VAEVAVAAAVAVEEEDRIRPKCTTIICR